MLLDAFRDFGAALSRFTERWVPDSWVLCMILTAVALGLAIFGCVTLAERLVIPWHISVRRSAN